jgi:hypothetical protein
VEPTGSPQDGVSKFRQHLATWIVLFAALGVIVLAWRIITITPADGTQQERAAQQVLSAVLPLLGTWVGTILAFYFTRENFEAAARSVSAVARQLTPEEKLGSTPVRDAMIAKDKMFYKNFPADKIPLAATLAELASSKKGERIPVFATNDTPAYMVHRSRVDKYLAKYLGDKAASGEAPNQNALTLQNILDEDPELKKEFETSWATVREDATLADAKAKMDRTPNCQDVFVTKNGTRDEAVRGWITNGIIEEHAKL